MLARWRPFEIERRNLMDRMSRIFDETMAGEGRAELAAWSPSVNIYEKGGALVVEAELPGVDKKDVDVRVENGVLTLKGERKHDREVKDENYYRCERAFGSFSRSFTLPSGVEPADITARFEDGVLTLMIPQKEEAKAKQIAIE